MKLKNKHFTAKLMKMEKYALYNLMSWYLEINTFSIVLSFIVNKKICKFYKSRTLVIE